MVHRSLIFSPLSNKGRPRKTTKTTQKKTFSTVYRCGDRWEPAGTAGDRQEPAGSGGIGRVVRGTSREGMIASGYTFLTVFAWTTVYVCARAAACREKQPQRGPPSVYPRTPQHVRAAACQAKRRRICMHEHWHMPNTRAAACLR